MRWELRFLSEKPKGITLTRDGMEFLVYARQGCRANVTLEERYKNPPLIVSF